MPTVLLVRHGRTSANASGVLAGWMPDVHLDDAGREQAAALAERLEMVPVSAAVSSPLPRCVETADALLGSRGVPCTTDERLAEARYGDWTGRPLRELAKDKTWRVVQDHPSAAVFPGEDGEAMAAVAARAVAAVREHDRAVLDQHGDGAIWVAVSHGDVIKAVLADALGMHLDHFQRIVVDPCSVSVVRYTPLRPFVVRVNDTAGALSALAPRRRRRRPRRSSDADVGGGAGSS
ncbi:MAG: MSMEG_4193 family putative phosphomutase [Jiangellales bacterium]